MTPEVKPVAALQAAFAVPSCTTDSGDLACKLGRFLPVLDVVAAVLAIALVVVLGIAVHAWRKNRETESGQK